MKSDNFYFNYEKALSYNCLLTIIIGERGVGKTYGAKDYVINHYKKKGKKFAWIRRYGSDLDSAIGTKKKCEFFNDIKEKHPGEYAITENKKVKNLIMNKKVIGYGMSLKSAESLKGTAYNDVDTIILDEFLVGDGGSRYIPDEPMYLLSIIESIARLRKIRVILLGNATSVYNPYFEFFDVHLPYKTSYQTFKNNTILVVYIKNEAYREAKKESEFGKLVQGTKYEKYAIDNEFINDNNNYIDKKPNNARLFCNIIIGSTIYGVWLGDYKLYVSKKFNANYKVNISFADINKNSKLLQAKAKNVFIMAMANHFINGTLYFENQTIKHTITNLLAKARLI